jgi:hypothetical protein
MRKLTIIPTVLIWAVVIAVTAGLLYYNGRSLICPCGTVEFYAVNRGAGHDSQHFFDIYAFSHILHGLLFYLAIWAVGRGRIPLLAGVLIATVMESGWELFENSKFIIDRYKGAGFETYNGDSVINVVGDIITMTIGYLIAAFVPVWASVLLFFGVEIGMALYIRDNLVLNIISLTYPIEAITQWQEGAK